MSAEEEEIGREFNYDLVAMASEIITLRQTVFWMSRTIGRKSEIIEEFKMQQVRQNELVEGMGGFRKEKILG